MLNYDTWQKAQAKVEPLRKQVMEAILKDERFNASVPNPNRDNLLRVDIKNLIFDLIFGVGSYRISAEINLLPLGFLGLTSYIIIFEGDYELYDENIKKIVDDLYLGLSKEIPNTKKSLRDLIKECKRALKLKVKD